MMLLNAKFQSVNAMVVLINVINELYAAITSTIQRNDCQFHFIHSGDLCGKVLFDKLVFSDLPLLLFYKAGNYELVKFLLFLRLKKMSYFHIFARLVKIVRNFTTFNTVMSKNEIEREI